ncbi:glycerophosphate oxidase 1 isoform X2 [Temnothorax americanus]|uniref:glycerophosphate oxidase 1 isoform X2 n=1 Tax=Temnothorax americanus TaxID=1964332 RepID=UPI0040698D19
MASLRLLVAGASAVGAGTLTSYFLLSDNTVHAEVKEGKPRPPRRTLPTREDQVKTLKSQDYDVLIIGGGATGAGCALDACTRGLKTALIEADDFASGTSSRSTKLIHGGVRYLQKAIMQLDVEQYRMVKEALHERASMLRSAPHLAHPLPIMLPVYTYVYGQKQTWWKIPYYWFGIKMYDLVAGSKTVKSSYYLSKSNALELFPMLKGDKLSGAIVYYDGQQDDARMNLAVALTASRHGATVVNHVKVVNLLKGLDRDGQRVLVGAHLKDELTGEEWDVKAKAIINATGPFTDHIRKMDDQNVQSICCPSSGVHIVLPGYYSPDQMGLLDPATSDGRVIFFLPWQKQTIAGTTDLPCEVTHNPRPTEDEIMFILQEVKNYLNPDVEVRRGDVLSAWSGIRPLVSDPNKPNTQSLARNHIVHVSSTKLITIAGGKWTTYRAMAQETIDAAIDACNLEPERPCQTDGFLLEGAQGWTPTMYIRLVQDFGLECEVAQHLSKSYGDRAFAVAKMASLTGKRWPIIGKKIHPEFPYIDAEIRYGVREYARTAIDMIARRLRLAFLNVQAAQEALPGIIDIMAEELHWSAEEKKKQQREASEFLAQEMGQMVNRASRDKIPINLTKDEIQLYIKRFRIIDKDKKGYVSVNDIRRGLKVLGIKLIQDEMHSLLNEIDVTYNGQMELQDYLQMMSAIKSGHVAYSRFARMAEMEEAQHEKEILKKQITVERSGGGL